MARHAVPRGRARPDGGSGGRDGGRQEDGGAAGGAAAAHAQPGSADERDGDAGGDRAAAEQGVCRVSGGCWVCFWGGWMGG